MSKPTHEFNKYGNALPVLERTEEDNRKIKAAQDRYKRRLARWEKQQIQNQS